jgi:hypothetical protein
MSLMRPNATVTIDGQTLTAAQAGLVWLEADLTVSGAHDAVRLEVARRSPFAGVAPGASFALALGDTGSEEDVLTGEVAAPATVRDGSLLEAYAATAALSHTYKSQAYLGESIRDIVSDLASSIAIDEVRCGIQLAAYYADNRRPVWTHLQTLAGLARADLGCSAAGALRFVPPSGGLMPIRLRHRAELLDWNVGATALTTSFAVMAHGAGSEAGANKWHWLRHDPVGAGAEPARIAGGIGTRAAAELAGRGLKGAAARAVRRGSIAIAGDATIRPGDVVELADLPGTDPGSLRVLRVQHRLDSRSGFVTRLSVEGSGAGGLP